MSSEWLLLVVLNVVVILLVIAVAAVLFWNQHSARHRELAAGHAHAMRPLPIEQPVHNHEWRIASRETTAGKRVHVLRCEDCGSIERREVDEG